MSNKPRLAGKPGPHRACGVERVGSSFSPTLFGERKSHLAFTEIFGFDGARQKRPSKLSSSRLKIYRQKMANEALEAEGHSSTMRREPRAIRQKRMKITRSCLLDSRLELVVRPRHLARILR